MNSAKMSLFTSFFLKLVGTILILASLLDYIVLAIPFRYQQEQWLVGFITQVVDRGIIPMIGIVFIIKEKRKIHDLKLFDSNSNWVNQVQINSLWLVKN